MYDKHQESCKGDFSFMEELVAENLKIKHIDSYNIEGTNIRFQGSFYYSNKDVSYMCDDAPLEVLKIAKNYSVRICTGCGSRPHLVLTIWF